MPAHLCPACACFDVSCPLDPAGPVPACAEFAPLDFDQMHRDQLRLMRGDWRQAHALIARELEAHAVMDALANRELDAMEGRP